MNQVEVPSPAAPWDSRVPRRCAVHGAPGAPTIKRLVVRRDRYGRRGGSPPVRATLPLGRGSPAADRPIRSSGGRSWWAHFAITRINMAPTFLYKKIEEQLTLGAFSRF